MRKLRSFTRLAQLVVMLGQPGDRSLQTVRAILADTEKISVAIGMLCKSEAWGGILARFGSQLQQFKDKELSSTLTTTNRFLRFLDSPHIERAASPSVASASDNNRRVSQSSGRSSRVR